jgi:uncharacterized protein (DUF58 family)
MDSTASSDSLSDSTSDPIKREHHLVKPAGRLLAVLAVWLVAGLIVHLVPTVATLQPVWLWIGAGLLVIALFDLWTVINEDPDLNIERRAPGNWPLNSGVNVQLAISHHGNRSLDLLVHDLYPHWVDSEGLPRGLRLAAGEQVELNWRATARRRGFLDLEHCHLAWLSPLGLWWRRRTASVPSRIRVYPNFNLVVQYGLLAGDRRLEEMGIHLARKRGIGSDFHQLRDYRDGDSLRQIDWHATARMRKLISREYQEERDQRVVFLLDCSRRMRVMDGALSHFDQCLNAMLLLSHVAIKQGDEIALHTMAASDGRAGVLSAGRGQRQFSTLMETVFDLEAGNGYPDFHNAAAELMSHQRRRSLVIILTNLRDEDHDELDPALKLLRQRHLVILADLRETISEQSLPVQGSGKTSQFNRALLQAGTSMYREQRKAATRQLNQHGVIHLDIAPEALPAALVSQYRRLKAGGIF